MKLSDVSREVVVDGTKVVVSLGDTVWWFAEAQTSSVPCVAQITRFNDNDQVQLSYNPVHGNRFVSMVGVCMVGDKRLTNQNVRKQGCWAPRGLWPSLKIEVPTSGT